jgi:hypothetical protein
MMQCQAERGVIEEKASYINCRLMLDDQKKSVQTIGLRWRPPQLSQHTDFTARIAILASAYSHPSSQPVGDASVRHQRMLAQFHVEMKLGTGTEDVNGVSRS